MFVKHGLLFKEADQNMIRGVVHFVLSASFRHNIEFPILNPLLGGESPQTVA